MVLDPLRCRGFYYVPPAFNIQELCDLLTCCFIWFSEEAAVSFLNSTNRSVLVRYTHNVFFEVETISLNIIWDTFDFRQVSSALNLMPSCHGALIKRKILMFLSQHSVEVSADIPLKYSNNSWRNIYPFCQGIFVFRLHTIMLPSRDFFLGYQSNSDGL